MSSGNGSGDVEALRAEIRQTRAELGETVQALAARVDVKARMRESADRTKQRIQDQAAHTADVVRESVRGTGEKARRNAVPWALIAVAATAATVLVVLMRGRRR
ncbi:Protein of unknown function [Micromonospora pattaloongensis]|uniref:DUF3618 domain-containing protein n=1 Tax=Micromonospora pattaloongensis TaxID=405436 RepID=A0A1H3S5X5_9ACTN|nr:DUF3618 domain-containing protein [Micromonospora pattaloongensis]SDZ33513.1 Protein of unknown function [Micromonospora pattaloongensis]